MLYLSRLARDKRDLSASEHIARRVEALVVVSRYTHTPLSEVASYSGSMFGLVSRALDKIIEAENTPQRG